MRAGNVNGKRATRGGDRRRTRLRKRALDVDEIVGATGPNALLDPPELRGQAFGHQRFPALTLCGESQRFAASLHRRIGKPGCGV
jgi:hypothetical protein